MRHGRNVANCAVRSVGAGAYLRQATARLSQPPSQTYASLQISADDIHKSDGCICQEDCAN
jgi:hypothetical protein